MDYVLVLDVSENGSLYYHDGNYDQNNLPTNTQKYDVALKMTIREDAEILCNKINNIQKSPYKYHVEEHDYFHEQYY